MSDPAALTLADAAQALRRRELSSEELVQACRRRIERWQPRINAFVSQEPRNSGREGPLQDVSWNPDGLRGFVAALGVGPGR